MQSSPYHHAILNRRSLLLPLVVCLLLIGTPSAGLHAQAGDPAELQTDTTKKKGKGFIPIPIVFATPETSWGFGGGANYTFRFPGESETSLTSQSQILAAYTLNKQLLLYLSYQLFMKEERYKVYGELGYYRYNYFFYGNGNQNTLEEGELYDVNYPRLRANALYLVQPNLYLGLRYWMDDFRIQNLDPEGRLANNNITGSQGGLLSGVGLVMNYDTRDNIFVPYKGVYIESVLFRNGGFLGSDFNFSKLYLDASTYIRTFGQQTLAFNLYTEFTAGDPPFNQLSLMGSRRRMRGYYEGRYRDQHYITFQGEYRMPLFWRLGIVLFGGYGAVANDFAEFSEPVWRHTVGAGLRVMIDKKERINIRVDAGFGQNTSAYYFTIGEAF